MHNNGHNRSCRYFLDDYGQYRYVQVWTEEPLFTFPLLLRGFFLGLVGKIRIDWKRQGSQARVVGTLMSIVGMLSMTFYKGPVVNKYSPSFLQLARPHLLVFTSTHENCVLGCFLFAAASFALTIWNNIQAGSSKKRPHVMKITCLYTLFGTIQSAVFNLF
ncbi:WAT1-related protein At1g70260-like [Nicotiana tomentosiformis]|uniref:WAT1-related protein At1g70260-like n=1 Tax=Nicotiana tomentosiformis TaxID=4098 RepID=UPI00051AE48F|nr:WAT1-related protein At1g70260-like [Nicotiana tomentosiformis]